MNHDNHLQDSIGVPREAGSFVPLDQCQIMLKYATFQIMDGRPLRQNRFSLPVPFINLMALIKFMARIELEAGAPRRFKAALSTDIDLRP